MNVQNLLTRLRKRLDTNGTTEGEPISQEKKKIDTKDLCEHLPLESVIHFDGVRSLDSDEKPKFSHLLSYAKSCVIAS